ncbi:hypothetical protein JCM8115_004996 [Rhodotorula mucilaginosa]|uniref:Monopolin complex subunit Csm1/Pcs1 C-terminal domain-containing protein n=1 Tax=Rhodotorula mucilaginosa TaxID=5537 RepID=A0A9P6W8X8_RHOMI|nr:hypothetical protein C6P46_000060 [Rhodotorula mucilaginosa]TKA57342.1 hypothetical protein B0A53_00568 [Rhodotorula sp. CCFEE 5036]
MAASTANKENRAPAAGKAAAAKQTRKPATKATKGRAPPAATRALSGEDHDVDDDDDDDELMMSERGEGDDDAAAAAADETTEVAETQFDSVKANARKGKAPATSSRRTAAAAAAAAAAQAGVQKKTVSAEDAIADELSGSILGPGKISAREKKLEAQLVLTQKALADYKDKFAKLSELRTTKAEAAEMRLREIADERQKAAEKTISTYKAAADAITAEHATLQETAFASPRSKAARLESMRVCDLEAQNAELLARVEELESAQAEERAANDAARREMEKRHEAELNRRVKDATAIADRDLAELRQEVKMTRAELSAEVAQSKALQQKLKSVPASSATAPGSLAGHGTVDALKLELEQLTTKLNLNEDLTGFAVHSVRQEEQGAAYTCMLNDCAGVSGSLNFKLVFHPDGTVSYTPDVEPSRDATLVALLPEVLQGYMRFPADHSSEFFKRLFTSVNKVKL